MDLDEAIESALEGKVVQRPGWGPNDAILRAYDPKAPLVLLWRTTRMISCPDMVADDWMVIGRVQ